MNPLKKLVGQTAIYGLSSIVGRLLNYLLVPLYTRYFSPSEYGEVTYLYAFAAFLIIILTYGMETAFFRFSEQEKNKDKVYSTTLISLLASSIVFIFLCVVFLSNIADLVGFSKHPEYIIYFAIILALDAITSISFAYLRAHQQAARFALVKLVNIFVNIGLNLFFIIYCPYAIENNLSSSIFIQSFYIPSHGIAYIFIANLVASATSFLMLFPEMLSCRWVFDNNLWKKMMIYAAPLMIAGLAGITNETFDRIILKYLLPENLASSEIGLYSAFYKLSIIMTLFIQTFRFAAEPFFFAQQKEINAKKIYADVLKYFTIVTSFIFLTVMVYYDLVKHFIGSDFQDPRGSIIVPILLMANLFLGLYYNLSIWYKLTGKTTYGASISIFGALLTIILNFALIPILGFVGSAWTTLICYLSMVFISYYFGKKHYPINYPVKRISFYILLSLGLFIVAQSLIKNMLYNNLLLLLFLSVAYALEKPKKSLNSNPELFD